MSKCAYTAPSQDGSKITKSATCSVTHKTYSVTVDAAAYRRWKAGELIQRAIPELNGDQREFLITGYTPEEWNKVFGTK